MKKKFDFHNFHSFDQNPKALITQSAVIHVHDYLQSHLKLTEAEATAVLTRHLFPYNVQLQATHLDDVQQIIQHARQLQQQAPKRQRQLYALYLLSHGHSITMTMRFMQASQSVIYAALDNAEQLLFPRTPAPPRPTPIQILMQQYPAIPEHLDEAYHTIANGLHHRSR